MMQGSSFHSTLFKRMHDGDIKSVSRRNSFTVTSRSSGRKKAVDQTNNVTWTPSSH